MANFQTHHHHHHKSTHHQNQHCHGSHLTESLNAPERSNTDRLPHNVSNRDTHEHSDIQLHPNPHHNHYHKQHRKHSRRSNKSHRKTSTMSAAGSSLCSSFSSSASSSCSSTSGSSSSSSSTTSSASTSNSSSSSSFDSSSFSSSASSSSDWSSDSSLDNAKFASKFKKGVRCPQHSQSCTDISRERRAFEEDEEDTVPLLNEDARADKSASLNKYCSVKKKYEDTNNGPNLSQTQPRKSTSIKKTAPSEIVRKAKSMEVLPMQNKPRGNGELDEKEIEMRKEEARKNIMEEKMKFSAFLNEITRQIISPSRLQTLGVTDAHKPISPAKSENANECKGHKKPKYSSRRSGSTNSVSSSAPMHTRKHSTGHVKSFQACNSTNHHHHHNTKQRNPKHLHHSSNRHTSNETGSSKSQLRRSEHGHKAHHNQQAQSRSHLMNDSAMDTKRSTQRPDSHSPTSHHDYTRRGDSLSSSSHPSPSHHRPHRSPELHSSQTENRCCYMESHRHPSTSLSLRHRQTTHHHVPHPEAHHRHHSHSDSQNQLHHDDQSSPRPSQFFDNDHHLHSESHQHVPSSFLFHHSDQSPSSSGTNFSQLKTRVYSQSESFHRSSLPSHQNQHSDAERQTPSSHQYSLPSKTYDRSHSESLHHSPSPSPHYHGNNGDHRSLSPSALHHHGDQRSQSSQPWKSQDHLEPPQLHHLHQDHKNPTPHCYTLPSKTHGLHSPSEVNDCDSYSRSHHSSLPDIQCHSSHSESSHPHHYSTNQDSHGYHPPHYWDNSSSELDHVHHDSTPQPFHSQHHSSYPDVHHYHQSNPPSDYHHHSYPNVHTHTEGGLTSRTDHEPGSRRSDSLYIDRHHQHPSDLDPHFVDSKPPAINRQHHSPDGHCSQHHPHILQHSGGYHKISHPDTQNTTISKSYHQHDHHQSTHYRSSSEAKFDHHKEPEYHHNSPESHKDSHHYSHNSHQTHKHQEFHTHSISESPYHQWHTESQHYPEHSKTHHYEFQRSSHHKMPSHMESHHHHHSKHSESHQHSHPKSLHHSSHSEKPLQYNVSKSHQNQHPESYPHSEAEPERHSDGKSYHPESRHHHFHTKEHQHHGGDASSHRHSPVGEKATSPCSSKSDSSRNTGSPIRYEDRSVTYQETDVKEKGSDYERMMLLQEQNEDLHNTLRQTVVRMECLGAEFITEHHQLESELQRTRMQLSSMMDKFTRLQANYSSNQQTDDLHDDETHCMEAHMDADREKLNQQISELTKQLSVAKTTIQSLETINVTSVLQEAFVKHLKLDDPLKPAVTPPPFQFMDSDHYSKSSVAGDEQSLGPVLEEDETDWSEMGEEAKDYACSSLDRGQHSRTGFSTLRREQGCWVKSDTESESGGEEVAHSRRTRHLQFSIHPEFLPVPVVSLKQNQDGPEGEEYHIHTGRQLSSPIRLLSASLERINSTGLHHVELQSLLKCTKGKMDQPHQCAAEDWTEDEFTHNWKKAIKQQSEDGEKGAGSSGSEPMASLEPAQKMLNHFIQEGEKTKL